jgi:fumarylacetoacetate (FAA) hydrolase
MHAMRLATLRDGTRDGTLVVVDAAACRFASARAIAPTLQLALDDWARAAPALRALSSALEADQIQGHPYDPCHMAAPLPRAYEWLDGSAYLNHIRLVRAARKADLPPGLESEPLVYQGGSGVLLGPCDPIALPDPAWGLDFESEVCAILGDVPCGTPSDRLAALEPVRLLLLANDITYRNLVPAELAKGFGFVISKPATAFSPLAVTPDELGPNHFREGRAFLRLWSIYNGTPVGQTDTGPEMHFSFLDLIAHIVRTRALTAGTILGSGTVSNRDPARGVSCLAERRMLETIASGAPATAFMKRGDTIRIEAFTPEGRSVFGAIDQQVI